MARLLFLCHRIPYPPVKGEKIRAWHMLTHLARRWDIELGCLAQDEEEMDHLPVLRIYCPEVQCRLVPRRARIARTLLQARRGRPLSLGWFRDAALHAWAAQRLASGRFDAVLAYSSAMAPYAMGPAVPRLGLRRVLDMVDVDSEKYRAYAATTRGPRRLLWSREARTLLSFERRCAHEFDRTLFVAREERDRFAALAPECADSADWVDNGVDLARFDPAAPFANPYRPGTRPIVFTGTMDYRPNIEAACWFADAVLPRLRAQAPNAEFHIVGADPAPAVRALATQPGITVTGTVPDIRPYLAHAAVAVAPLGIARGIQNKVLEAMALARPVVASPEAFAGVRATPGRDLLLASGAAETTQRITEILEGRYPAIGLFARNAMEAGHDWAATLQRLDGILRPEPALLDAVA